MTSVFSDNGSLLGVTAIEAGPCAILAVNEKTLQLGFQARKGKRIKKPLEGYFKKLNINACKFIKEVIRDPAQEYKVGDEVKVDIFKAGDFVDIKGISKGKGFQGGMKRWNWRGGPMTHGSTSHRRIGSLGSSTTPGRVWKGQHLPGHMGAARVTLQNLKVVKVDAENNVLLVNGSVPGARNSFLVIRIAKKKSTSAVKKKSESAKKK